MLARQYQASDPVQGLEVEQHYTIYEIAEKWHVSARSVHRLFLDEPGVLKIGTLGEFGKRKGRTKITLRIPASVLARLHEQRSRGFRLEVQRVRGGVQ